MFKAKSPASLLDNFTDGQLHKYSAQAKSPYQVINRLFRFGVRSRGQQRRAERRVGPGRGAGAWVHACVRPPAGRGERLGLVGNGRVLPVPAAAADYAGTDPANVPFTSVTAQRRWSPSRPHRAGDRDPGAHLGEQRGKFASCPAASVMSGVGQAGRDIHRPAADMRIDRRRDQGARPRRRGPNLRAREDRGYVWPARPLGGRPAGRLATLWRDSLVPPRNSGRR